MFNDFLQFKELIQNDSYSKFSIVSPFVVVYMLSPDSFPENKIGFIFFILFYTLFFRKIYNIYFNSKLKINKNLITKIAVPMINSRPKIVYAKDKLDNWKTIYPLSSTYNSNLFTNFILKNIETQVKKTEGMIQKIDLINKNLDGGLTLKEYKGMDYFIMFAISFMVIVIIANIIPGLDGTSLFINSNGFIFIFFAIVILYTFLEYLNYIKIQLLSRIFLRMLSIGITLLEIQCDKYNINK